MVVLTNLPPPSEGVRFQQGQVSAVLQLNNLGLGTLYVAESCVSWVDGNGQGFSLQYPAISLHAVSRDLSTFPQECIYVMVEAKSSELTGIGGATPNGEASDAPPDGAPAEEPEEEDSVTEIRFVPIDKSVLDEIFEVMAECQALHPDEQDSFSEGEDDEEYEESIEVLGEGGGPMGDGFFTAPEDVQYLNEEGQATLARLTAAGDGTSADGMEQDESESMETGQFDDAPQDHHPH